MPIRAVYVNNPFYLAGRRERRFYGRFYLRDVTSVCDHLLQQLLNLLMDTELSFV